MTKGDANNQKDAALLYPSQILGKAVFTIPYLGYVIAFIQQPPGLYIAISLAVAVVLMTMLTDLILDKSNKEQ